MIATTSVNVAVETPAPPYSFGTVIPQRPVCENHSISSKGKRRSLSRATDPVRICSANCRAASNACSSLLIRCASAISNFDLVSCECFQNGIVLGLSQKQQSCTKENYSHQKLMTVNPITRRILIPVTATTGKAQNGWIMS